MEGEGNPASSASPGTSLSAEDRVLAATLQQAVYELGATAGTAMVPLEDSRTPANVVAVGGPLSIFPVADSHPVDDERYTGSVAYRTGRQCVRVRSETPSGVRPAMPFPYAIVATPLVSQRTHRLGAVRDFGGGSDAPPGPRQQGPLPQHSAATPVASRR
jgi:hypothetical protein